MGSRGDGKRLLLETAELDRDLVIMVTTDGMCSVTVEAAVI